MKKELITEINRYRELMSLSSQNLINESSVGEVLKKIGRESIEQEIKTFMEIEAKKIAQEIIAAGKAPSARGGGDAGKRLSKENIESIIKQIETKSKPLTPRQKIKIDKDLRTVFADEIRNSVEKETQAAAKQISKLESKISKLNVKILRQAEEFAKKNPTIKGSTPKSTWQNLKTHFGNNWGKYLASGLILGIFAYYWPNEEDTPEPIPEPKPIPPPSPCPVGDVDAVKNFHDWLDDYVPNWHDKYGKLEGSVQKGYGVCGPRTKKWWGLKKNEYLKKKSQTNPNDTTTTTTPTINQTTSGGNYLTDY